MRHLLVGATVLLIALPAHAYANAGGAQRVSGASPLDGRCEPNDRTVFYGEEPQIEEEVSVAVNPTHPNIVVVAWAQDLGRGIVAASTRDGGQHWHTTVVPGLSTCTDGQYDRVIHPRLSFGPDGVVYLLTAPLDGFWPDPRSAIAHIAVSRSHDGGRTWEDPEVLNTAPLFNDLGGLAAEPDVPGAAVVVWSHPEVAVDAMYVSRTTDHGRTWSASLVRTPSPANVAGKVIVAHPDGTLLVFVRDDTLDAFFGVPVRQRPVSVIRSDDKGRSWSDAEQVTPDSDAHFWPLAAAAPDGATYLVWGTATEDGRLRLRLRASQDAGTTWAPEREVATVDFAPGSVSMQPSIAAGAGGLVALAHYQHTEDGMRVLLTKSHDGGATWTTTTLAGPFAEDHIDHWLQGPTPIGYQVGLAARGRRLTTAFVASGSFAERGLTDVYLTHTHG